MTFGPADVITLEKFHMRYTRYRRRAASVAWLGSLALVAGLSFTCEVQAGCREVCTPQTSCEGLSGEGSVEGADIREGPGAENHPRSAG